VDGRWNNCGVLRPGPGHEILEQPLQVATGLTAISASGGRVIAIGADGHLLRWGRKMVDTTTDCSYDTSLYDTTPITVPSLTNVRQAVISSRSSVMILADRGLPTSPSPTSRPTTPPPPKVAVPAVVSAKCATAKTILQDAGLTGTCTSGYVTRQNPAEGTLVNPGTSVSLTTGASPP
jgi:hypothetical protein